jgi:2-C-methyl-D-erythritol 4-phosphate cytidylyltransferase
VPAAGKSSRFHDKNYKKPFAPLAGRAVWLHSAERFLARDDVKQFIVVISPEDREYFTFKFGANVAILGIDVVDGGAERADSVAKALARVKPDIEYVAFTTRPGPAWPTSGSASVFEAAKKSGAAILAMPVSAARSSASAGSHDPGNRLPRRLWEAQTPQVFAAQVAARSPRQAAATSATDDAQLVERIGHRVTVVTGSPVNLKITTREDLRLAEQALKAMPKPKFTGPAHPFADDDMWR